MRYHDLVKAVSILVRFYHLSLAPNDFSFFLRGVFEVNVRRVLFARHNTYSWIVPTRILYARANGNVETIPFTLSFAFDRAKKNILTAKYFAIPFHEFAYLFTLEYATYIISGSRENASGENLVRMSRTIGFIEKMNRIREKTVFSFPRTGIKCLVISG